MEADSRELLENEWYLVRHSGETPEIALHSALYFLTRAKDGPQLELSGEQRLLLLEAAVERFREIILRDLDHNNSATSVYRGLQRSIVNFHRFRNFCRRQEVDEASIRLQAAAALRLFIAREVAEVGQGRAPLINCSHRQLREFASALELDETELPEVLISLCPTAE